ncbi:uncharacterized protein LOC144475933 isoform X2 [Augochlora pura]
MIATTMKNALLVGVLATICLTQTRAYVSFDQVNIGNTSDSGLPKNSVPEQDSGATTENPKLVRVPLIRRYPRTIDGSLATINENNPQRLDRVTVTGEPTTTEATRGVRRGAKRNQKKLKLTQAQGRKKSKKTKRHIGSVDKQQNVDSQNRLSRFGGTVPRNYKDDNYYVQRRAGPQRYDLGLQIPSTTTESSRYYSRVTPVEVIGNTRPSTTSKTPRSPANLNWLTGVEEDTDIDTNSYDYEENDYDTVDAVKPTTAVSITKPTTAASITKPTTAASITKTTPVPTTTHKPKDTGRKSIEFGDCKNVGNSLFYQHNLLLDVTRGTTVETELMASISDGHCVVCIRIKEPTPATASRPMIERPADGNIMLKIEATRDEHIELVAQFYTGDKSTRSSDCL